MYSDGAGDVPLGSIGGLLVNDTRLISRWELTLNGQRPILLRSKATTYYSAAFFLTNQPHLRLPANSLDVRRLRVVGRNGLHERIRLQSFAREQAHLELRLRVGADFADFIEIRGSEVRDRSAQVTRSHAADGSRLSFGYRNAEFAIETTVHVKPPASRTDGDDLVWDIVLSRNNRFDIDLHIPITLGPMDIPSVHIRSEDSEARNDPTGQWHAERPHLQCDLQLLVQVMDKSADDLLALRARALIDGQEITLPAAGSPWFQTLFGRDTLITAYQTVGGNPHLARGALISLAKLQGRRCNDFTDEEPGKILHEYRSGEFTQLGIRPYNPYFGTADATQLWLILLSEYWRWTCDNDLVQKLRGNALAALEWIDRYGDRDGDGYVEYGTRSPQGLGNQGWRDSWDGVQFADGTIPVLPIATCELQGYTYDAKLRLAELADGPLADQALAARLRSEAMLLSERFNEDFWIDERGGYYAVGLDGDKHQIDSMTSNMGHLLWSGIVPPERAPILAQHLMSDAMFSGWGIRTLSTDDDGYNPIGYHTGTVWPHDNSLIMQGLTQYGHRTEANRVAMAILEAAGAFAFRLPEVFAGYPRTDGSFPVPYPTPCSPQAWASGAPLQLLAAMLGLDARDNHLTISPALPEELGRVLITRLHAFGQRWTVEAVGSTGHVRLTT
jgi:glycogen debranching enzyme